MEQIIRKAVRCYIIKDNKIIAIKYKEGNRKAGYYDIPGGKIEEGETPEQTAFRETKEETGIEIKNLKQKGTMTIEYSDTKFIFDMFIINEYEGNLQEFTDNIAEWIEIEELLKKDKILYTTIVLNKTFIKALKEDNYRFNMYIKVDDNENVLEMDYRLEQ